MIKLFEIKNKIKNKKILKEDTKIIEKYKEILSKSKEEVLKEYSTNIEKGLAKKEAEKRLEQDGENVVIQEKKRSWLYFFLKAFQDKFIYILVILSIINYFASDDKIGTIIILGIGLISAIIKFAQNYSTYRFNQKLKSELFTTATVLREEEETVRVENVVKGDIVHLNAGSMIPADVMILESKDLFINQAVFTGESIPVEKTDKYEENDQIFSISNLCLMGTSVISGSATALVINTGFETYLGGMGKQIDNKKEITNFQKGMDGITKLLIRYMVVVSIAVFIIYAFIRKDFMEAMLFALSVAVGITPTMLPMIVNVNLTNINAGNGIDALTAQLDYDTNVFETVTTSDIKSATSWTPTFASQTNKMTALKNEKVKTSETVFSITLKVKSSISVDSTKVTLKNIVVSGGIVANGGTGDINVNDISVTISKAKAAESTTENTTKNDEITISKNENKTTGSKTKNTVAKDNTTAKKTLPKTGLQEYGVIAIVVVAIVGTFSYFVYKRIAKDVK